MSTPNKLTPLILRSVAAVLCVGALCDSVAQGCTVLRQGLTEPGAFRYGPDKPAPGRTYIDQPGSYCLGENFRVEGRYLPTPDGMKLFSDDELIFMLMADDIVLDFNGHSATSDANLDAGIRTPRGRSVSSIAPVALPSLVPKHLTIKNGTIKVTRHGMAIEVFGLGPQQELVNIVKDATEQEYAELEAKQFFQKYPTRIRNKGISIPIDSERMRQWIRWTNEKRAALRATFLPNAAAYPVRNLRIENMRLRSKDYAVVLQGAGSIVRDSVIETDSGTALWLYGPNAIIENNTFIVHCRTKPMSHAGVSRCDEMDAPIRLQHGDGSVIRNNRFILLDKAKPRAISVFDTGTFTFEGNVFVGPNEVDQAIEVYRGPREVKTSVPNRIDNGAFSKWRR